MGNLWLMRGYAVNTCQKITWPHIWSVLLMGVRTPFQRSECRGMGRNQKQAFLSRFYLLLETLKLEAIGKIQTVSARKHLYVSSKCYQISHADGWHTINSTWRTQAHFFALNWKAMHFPHSHLWFSTLVLLLGVGTPAITILYLSS